LVGSCSIRRGGKKSIQNYKSEETLGNLGVVGRIILELLFEIMDYEGVDWINLAQYRAQ
jgi:hypothetical protein